MPPCPSGTTAKLIGGLSASYAPLTCHQCGCGTPSPAVACATTATVWSGSTCNSAAPGCETGPITSTCAPLMANATATCGASLTGYSIEVSTVATSGSCAPMPTLQPTAGSPTWDGNVVACTLEAGGTSCDSGGTCTAAPQSALDAGSASCDAGGPCTAPKDGPFKLCIFQLGATSCPAPYQAFSTPVYTGFGDMRTCTECSCGAPTCPKGTATISATPGCDAGFDVGLPNSCTQETLQDLTGYYAVLNKTTAVPSCAVSAGGTLTGTAMPTGQTLVCCR